MKIRFVLATFLLASVAVCANGYGYNFVYHGNSGKMTFNTDPDATRGYDGVLKDVVFGTSFDANRTYLLIYKQRGVDGWDADNTFLVSDRRPLLQAGETDTINSIYLWAGTGVTPQALQLYIFEGVAGVSPGSTYKLRLVQVPASVTYTGPREWGLNHGTITLPFYATNDPLTGYKFQAEITAPPVPEPSSVSGLAIGIAALAGPIIRRKKKL